MIIFCFVYQYGREGREGRRSLSVISMNPKYPSGEVSSSSKAAYYNESDPHLHLPCPALPPPSSRHLLLSLTVKRSMSI